MNDDTTCDLQNKSLYGSPPRSYHEKPNIEFDNFVNISTTNLDAMEEKLQSINYDENIWDDVLMYKEISDKISEQIKIYSVDTAVIDGEIEYYKRKIHSRNEDISDINQLIQECVITFKDLESERSEMTRNIVNKHKAIKQATKYYKKRLNIHISIENKNKTDFVKISLFTQKESDEFSFILSINEVNKTMKLESTKPKLNDTRFSQIQTKFKEDQNVCALLCCMRKVFLDLK